MTGPSAFMAWLLAAHARSAAAYASQIDTLQDAITSRQLIGQAVGIATERSAFLARVSSHRNVKLRVIAQEIVDDRTARPGRPGTA